VRQRLVDAADRRLAAVAHLSIGFGIFIAVGFLLGLAINAVIWLRGRHSPIVSFHAEQAGTYQLVVLLTNLALAAVWIVGVFVMLGGSQLGEGMLSARQIVMGLWLALLPIGIIWYVGTILYGLYGGLMVALGREFSYPVIGPWVARRMAARARRP
jgi:uncharacterized Tic20 family protein